jgi:ABC-type multidrug transport system fused ATPase/permease subunit
MNDANSIVLSSEKLSELYEKLGNYKEAFSFSKQAKKFKDSLNNLSKGRDIALLGVERENKKHEEELRQENQRLNNKRNVQYMAISIAICIIFLGMLVMGMFAVSKLTIKLLGYFFFISLFEFIVMVIDNSFLAKVIHNEPLKLWLIKIVLIASLVPVQHFLEHNLIKFLESKKLLEARTKFSFKKWWSNIKKPAPAGEAGVEEDAAVL